MDDAATHDAEIDRLIDEHQKMIDAIRMRCEEDFRQRVRPLVDQVVSLEQRRRTVRIPADVLARMSGLVHMEPKP